MNPLENGEPVAGINPTFGLDTNGKSTPVLLVATSVPVTLENIKLTGGYIGPVGQVRHQTPTQPAVLLQFLVMLPKR